MKELFTKEQEDHLEIVHESIFEAFREADIKVCRDFTRQIVGIESRMKKNNYVIFVGFLLFFLLTISK